MHIIRLREPWELSESAAGTIHIRRFHKPTNLEPSEQVYLVIAESQGVLAMRLNSELLEMGAGFFSNNEAPPSTTTAEMKPDPFRCDVAARLLPRNELILELAPGGQRGEVCLQILNPQS